MGRIEKGQSEKTNMFQGRWSTLDHILIMHTLIKQEVFACQCLYSCFVDFKKAFDTVPRGKLWAHLQWLGVRLHLQHAMNAMYIVVYLKVCINGNTHGEVIGV